MESQAAQIARWIIDTDTDDRGILLNRIALKLEEESQYYTAGLFKLVADKYGTPRL